MKLKLLWFTMALAAAAPSAMGKINVVATTSDFAAIAREIGGDRVQVTALAKPTEDPHFIDAKPGFIATLNRADVLIEGGAALEQGWLQPLLQGARNPKITGSAPGHVQGNAGISMLGVPTSLDRSRGDIHPEGNPHYLIDPMNAKIVAANIAEAFSKAEPKAYEIYRANLKAFEEKIDARMVEWQKQMAPHKGASVVAYHDSWPYFAERFGLKIEMFLEPKPGIPPTPSHVASLVQKMREQNVRVILVDAYVNRRQADSVASKTGAVTVPVSHFPGGVKGTEGGYIELVDYLVKSISQALASAKQ
jgi:zinc/manganese transport system substrate-binding protein